MSDDTPQTVLPDDIAQPPVPEPLPPLPPPEVTLRLVLGHPSTGEIMQTIVCPERLAEHYSQGPQPVAAHPQATAATHHFDAAGALQAYTPAQIQRKAQRPSRSHRWSNAAMDWDDPRSLDEARSARWAYIKAERDRREAAGFPYLGQIFDSDPRAVQRITTAVQAAQAALTVGVPFHILWTAADGSSVPLDAGAMVGLPAALARHADQLHQDARRLREQIDAAPSVLAIDAIDWPG